MILYRNDTWGTDYNTFITSYLESNNITRTIHSYSYNHDLPPGYLTEAVAEMKTLLETLDKTKTCIVYVGFDEFIDYISLVKNDPDFQVDHFATDAQAHVNIYLLPEYVEFLMNNNFKCVSYSGSKSDPNNNSEEIQAIINTYDTYSNHSLIYYDITDCIFHKNTDLDRYYGLSGNYIMENNRREYGACDILKIGERTTDIYYWYVEGIFTSTSKFGTSDSDRSIIRDSNGGGNSGTYDPSSIEIPTVFSYGDDYEDRIGYLTNVLPIIVSPGSQSIRYIFQKSVKLQINIERDKKQYVFIETNTNIHFINSTNIVIGDNTITYKTLNSLTYNISGTIYNPTVTLKINYVNNDDITVDISYTINIPNIVIIYVYDMYYDTNYYLLHNQQSDQEIDVYNFYQYGLYTYYTYQSKFQKIYISTTNSFTKNTTYPFRLYFDQSYGPSTNIYTFNNE